MRSSRLDEFALRVVLPTVPPAMVDAPRHGLDHNVGFGMGWLYTFASQAG